MEKIRKNSFEPGKEILGNADRVDRVSVNCSGSPPNLGCIGPICGRQWYLSSLLWSSHWSRGIGLGL